MESARLPSIRSLPLESRSLLAWLAFLGCAAVSFLHVKTALALCALCALVLVLYSRPIALAVGLGFLPFGYLFGLTATMLYQLCGLLLGLSVIGYRRYLWQHWKQADLKQLIVPLLYGAYIVLMVAHFEGLARHELTGLGAMFILLCVTLIARFAAQDAPQTSGLLLRAIVFGILAAAFLSALYTFVPLHWLAAAADTPDDLRLLGVLTGTNEGARFLLVPFCGALLQAATTAHRRGAWVGALALTAALIAFTGTKAALAASLGAGLLACILLTRAARLRALALTVMVAGIFLLWFGGLSQTIDRGAAERWQKINPDKLRYLTPPPPKEPPQEEGYSNKVMDKLRVGKAMYMTVEPDGKTQYHAQPDNVWDTGQRLRIWKAAWTAFCEHPLWGIGYRKWSQELMERISFPFVSPHNGFLEVAGAMGILGATLYLGLAGLLVQRFFRVRRLHLGGEAPAALLWVTLASAAMLAIELVDTSNSFTLSLNATWFWLLIATQEGLLAKRTTIS